jgi:coenzyme F420-0:L-glutamate ligase/coenzyme F420-1:gamma-L-glutamate ligase
MRERLELFALAGMPLVQPGDDLALLIADALRGAHRTLDEGDVVVVAQKIVSKAENRYRDLREVEPSDRAREIAQVTGKNTRFVQAVLDESSDVVRTAPNVLIVRHRNGYVYANAGIDHSNIDAAGGHVVLRLPENPDASAARLRDRLRERCGVEVAVIVCDSAGRPWRMGVIGIAIGCAGFDPLESRIGDLDLFDCPLAITEVAVADDLAAAASLLMGEANEARPVVIVRGAELKRAQSDARKLVRPLAHDLFR